MPPLRYALHPPPAIPTQCAIIKKAVQHQAFRRSHIQQTNLSGTAPRHHQAAARGFERVRGHAAAATVRHSSDLSPAFHINEIQANTSINPSIPPVIYCYLAAVGTTPDAVATGERSIGLNASNSPAKLLVAKGFLQNPTAPDSKTNTSACATLTPFTINQKQALFSAPARETAMFKQSNQKISLHHADADTPGLKL